MIKAELVLINSVKTANGSPVKARVYEIGERKYKYVSQKYYQKGKALKMDSFVIERAAKLKKEVDYCNQIGLTLAESQEIIKKGIPNDNQRQIIELEKKLRQLKNLSSNTFIDLIDRDIERRTQENKSVYALNSLKREITNYEKGVKLHEVDFVWVKDYITRKRKDGTGEGGLSYYIRTASTLFNDAVKTGDVKNNPFRGHRISRKRTKPREVQSFEDVRKLMNYTPKIANTKANRVSLNTRVNLFMFQIHIGGHYISDIANLKWSNIKGNRLVFQRVKNKSKEQGGEVISNMLTPYAIWFIDRYGTPEDENIFSWVKGTKVWVRVYGKSLGRISRDLEITPKLKSTDPRYIFRSAGGESRAHNLAIKQIQGHKFVGISEGYQGRFSNDFIDKEHRRILNYLWQEQDSNL